MRTIFTLKILLLCTFLSVSGFEVSAKEESPEGSKKDIKTEIKEYIDHHLKDSHDFSIFSYTEDNGEHVYVGIPLPVILWDEGLKVFSSSKFHHGETIAEAGGNYYALEHGKIYKTDAEGNLNHDEEGHVTNAKPIDFSITKNVVMMIITGALMLWLFSSLARSYAKNNGVPTGAGRFFEPIVIYIRDDIARPTIGEKRYRKYMPFLLTIFFFIWFLNMFGLTPLGINVTGNIAITFGLALLTFLITNFTGTKDYWKHLVDPLGDAMPWYGKIPIYIILVPIELLGLIIKPFALLIRLYANMQAGHIVLMSLIGLMFIFKSWIGSPLSFFLAFAITLIEVLVALLQAYIFTMLSSLYFGFASEEHDHEEEPELAHL
ncbi:ATP synthase F0 subcomplex A subunit [Muriicola jejuensis]|uniref:ATP synthase subunit a n=1 Tax=Muriicola jejuensis TaxID=504488 RepID=A0A6P0UBA9_9FLAO|nr:F0F1 ATP synthase subunit A [Muriicola jejuensis]NER09882.1 F0F1 ATP synthase subunit A [Muriicola jejuensis]SMP05069.1 ATP synthase F0 subcomplex A subunit [Muriicola jejuensis]